MGTIIAIANIIILLAIVILLAVVYTTESFYITRACMIIVLLGVIGFGILNGKLFNSPEAMDVYQGKTTLKYTIVDGERVDSVVVWKKN